MAGALGRRAASRHDPKQAEQIKQLYAEAMKQSSLLRSVRSLRIKGPTEEEMRFLQGLTTLECLEIAGFPYRPGSAITDAGLANVRRLTRLRCLTLEYAGGVTDAGLENLAALTELPALDLHETGVRGPGLKYLANLKKLEFLDLRGLAVGDGSIDAVLAFPLLSDLRLGGTKVTDKSLPVLAKMPNHMRLDLRSTMLSDKSLPVLAKLPPGADVLVDNTRITRRGVYATRGARAIVHAYKFADDLAPDEFEPPASPGSQTGNQASGADARDDRASARKLRAADGIGLEFDEKGENIIALEWSEHADPALLPHVAGLYHLRSLQLDAELCDDDIAPWNR